MYVTVLTKQCINEATFRARLVFSCVRHHLVKKSRWGTKRTTLSLLLIGIRTIFGWSPPAVDGMRF